MPIHKNTLTHQIQFAVSENESNVLHKFLVTRAISHAKNGNSYYMVSHNIFHKMPVFNLSHTLKICGLLIQANGLTNEKRFYKDFARETKNVSSLLRKQGMEKGDIVIFLTNDMLKLHAFFVGVWRSGGILRATYPEDEYCK